jgi:hypothetical protein
MLGCVPEVFMSRVLTLLALLALVCVPVSRVEAVPLGIETFDAAHDWVFGGGPGGQSPTPLSVQPGGGPGGASDPFLVVEALGGDGPQSRLSAQNFGAWAGDYTGAGVTQVQGQANNFGPEDVYLRLLFVEFGAMGPVNAALTTVAVHLVAGSGWQSFAFDVTASDLTAIIGTADGALANTQELRFFHNPAPFFAPMQMPPVTAVVGLDNLEAVADGSVPEPGSVLLLAAAGITVLARRLSART